MASLPLHSSSLLSPSSLLPLPPLYHLLLSPILSSFLLFTSSSLFPPSSSSFPPSPLPPSILFSPSSLLPSFLPSLLLPSPLPPLSTVGNSHRVCEVAWKRRSVITSYLECKDRSMCFFLQVCVRWNPPQRDGSSSTLTGAQRLLPGRQ